jgi:hypothetical protein
MATEDKDHARRAARNQALFREVNERVKEVTDGAMADRFGREWVCECSDETCTEHIAMTMEDYEAMREDPTHFAVAPNHVDPGVEVIVEQREGYWMVEKLGEAAEVVEELDTRPRP